MGYALTPHCLLGQWLIATPLCISIKPLRLQYAGPHTQESVVNTQSKFNQNGQHQDLNRIGQWWGFHQELNRGCQYGIRLSAGLAGW